MELGASQSGVAALRMNSNLGMFIVSFLMHSLGLESNNSNARMSEMSSGVPLEQLPCALH
jgi:hypothetical protein